MKSVSLRYSFYHGLKRNYPVCRSERVICLEHYLMLTVRHLVMPSCTSDSLKILDFLKETLPEGAPLSLMRQYTPMGEFAKYPELRRTLTAREYGRVVDYALALGFAPLYTQEKESVGKAYIPDWDF